jgi:hypothetical protein
MKVKKISKKMDENFTIEDFWKMMKLFALILFLALMGFLNAEPQLDEWKVLENPISTNGVIIIRKISDQPRAYDHVDFWEVLINAEPSNDRIVLFRSGRSPSNTWQCPKPSCGHLNYNDFLNCGLCGTYRYDKF